MKGYLRVMKQGAIASGVAAVIGGVYGLIRGIDFLQGANRFIYILGLLLIFYSIIANMTFLGKGNRDRDEKEQVYTKDEIEKLMKQRKDNMKEAPKDYARAATALLIAVLLEYLRFYVL